MYEYFYIFGPKTLPFTTNFCIGSGKNLFRMGKPVKKSWFNLKSQGIQPSTPSREGFFTHFYDDAFDGGSSLSLDSTELIRLFVCELDCDDDIILSYTFKRNSVENDVLLTLNLLDIKTSLDIQVVLEGSGGMNPFAISCLNEDDVRNIGPFIAKNHPPFIPSQINGWETRYYLLKFEKSKKVRVTDIGVKKLRHGIVLLGSMALYSAKNFNHHDFTHINSVQL